jgi:hypothetical protein
MAGLYFEEFVVGQEFHHELSRTVTEMDNTMFSLLTMNPQPLHIDAHFAETTEFGQRLFNSVYTLGIMIGMSVYDTTLGTTVGNLGMICAINPAVTPLPLAGRGWGWGSTRIVSRLEHRRYFQAHHYSRSAARDNRVPRSGVCVVCQQLAARRAVRHRVR